MRVNLAALCQITAKRGLVTLLVVSSLGLAINPA
jgi:hypothetical protein